LVAPLQCRNQTGLQNVRFSRPLGPIYAARQGVMHRKIHHYLCSEYGLTTLASSLRLTRIDAVN
jgi:hypothetical protein